MAVAAGAPERVRVTVHEGELSPAARLILAAAIVFGLIGGGIMFIYSFWTVGLPIALIGVVVLTVRWFRGGRS